jgi:HSP20 family molecular chaperone IbpA
MLKIRRTTTPTFNHLEDTFNKIFENSNNVFENIPFDPIFSRDWRLGTNLTDLTNVARYPINSVIDKADGSIKISFDTPGYNKDELEITYDETSNMLTVVSKTGAKTNIGDYRTFKYAYYLVGYDLDSLEASCENGVLTIFAKALPPPPVKSAKRTIEIK